MKSKIYRGQLFKHQPRIVVAVLPVGQPLDGDHLLVDVGLQRLLGEGQDRLSAETHVTCRRAYKKLRTISLAS